MPGFGRWLTPDPAGFTDGMNLYAYVLNNPLKSFDEYGLWLERRSEPFQAPACWRNGMAFLSHECYKPIAQFVEHDRSGEFFRTHLPSFAMDTSYRNSSWTQNSLFAGHGSIDRFWGTSLSHMYDPNSWANTTLMKLELPMPNRVFSSQFVSSSTSKIAPIAKRVFSRDMVGSTRLVKNARNFQLNRFHQAAQSLSETGKNNIRILRGWAKNKGWNKLPNPQGRPEIWGVNTAERFEFRLKIKAESSLRSGLDPGSGIPRFDARLSEGAYINPFTGEIGNSKIGTHIPLEYQFYE
jgi:hypothetical protein